MKKIAGFIRDIPSGTPLPNIPVTLYHEEGPQVALGNPYNLGPSNPVNTATGGARPGYFEFTMELSPGPVKIDAALGGSNYKIRSGYELMQAGDLFISDMSAAFNVFTNGVVNTLGNKFNATSSGLNITLDTGGAMLNGHLLQRTTTFALPPVPTTPNLAIRKDLVVLQQHVGGDYIGRQDIKLVIGAVNDTDPAINTDPNILELSLWRSVRTAGAGSVTLGAANDLRTYAYALQSPNSVNRLMLTTDDGTTTELSTGEARKLLTAPESGKTPLYNTLSLGELDNVVSTAPLDGSFLVWNGTAWAPVFSLTDYLVVAGDSATGADDPSTASQGTYAHAFDINFTLTGLAAARWSAHLHGGALFAHTGVDGGLINRRIELDAGNYRDDGSFTVVAQPGWDHYPFTLHLTNLTPGSKTVTMYYRVDPSSSGGTAFCRAPYLHATAWRTV